VANDTNAVPGLLARLGGATGGALRDQAPFRDLHAARFQGALGYAWANLQPLAEDLVRQADAVDAENKDADPKRPMPKRSKLLAVTGVTALQSLSVAWMEGPDGTGVELRVGIPATQRAGLFKLLEFEPRDSSPPPFVPIEATQFQRWRLGLSRAWATLEKMFTDAFPAANTVLNLLFQTAGKENDPDYDLKGELLGTLGDDLMSYALPPLTNTSAALSSPPSVSLLGSTNAERLVTALKAAATLLPPPLANVTAGELQGRPAYTLSLPSLIGTDSAPESDQSLTFAAGPQFVAFSDDSQLLATVLSATNPPARTLRELPGLPEAAQRVGGMGTGLFGYQDNAAGMRRLFESLRQRPDSALALVPPAYLLAITGLRLEEPLQRVLARCDFRQLPPFDPLQRYFHFTVYTGSVDAEGFSYRTWSPLPPALAQPAPPPPPIQSPNK
jgi:hypothetical protein